VANVTQCPDCGGTVSLRAATCPHCGAPMHACAGGSSGACAPGSLLRRLQSGPPAPLVAVKCPPLRPGEFTPLPPLHLRPNLTGASRSTGAVHGCAGATSCARQGGCTSIWRHRPAGRRSGRVAAHPPPGVQGGGRMVPLLVLGRCRLRHRSGGADASGDQGRDHLAVRRAAPAAEHRDVRGLRCRCPGRDHGRRPSGETHSVARQTTTPFLQTSDPCAVLQCRSLERLGAADCLRTQRDQECAESRGREAKRRYTSSAWQRPHTCRREVTEPAQRRCFGQLPWKSRPAWSARPSPLTNFRQVGRKRLPCEEFYDAQNALCGVRERPLRYHWHRGRP